jgi:hypothetical protein
VAVRVIGQDEPRMQGLISLLDPAIDGTAIGV